MSRRRKPEQDKRTPKERAAALIEKQEDDLRFFDQMEDEEARPYQEARLEVLREIIKAAVGAMMYDADSKRGLLDIMSLAVVGAEIVEQYCAHRDKIEAGG